MILCSSVLKIGVPAFSFLELVYSRGLFK